MLVIRVINLFVFVCMFLLNQALADDVTLTDKVDKRPELSAERKGIEESKSIIKGIISSEPFVDIQEEKIWNFEEDIKEENIDVNPDIGWLSDAVRFFSMIIEAALWLVPILIVFYLYRYREYWFNLVQANGLQKDQPDIPETLFGLDIRKESLPDDIENAAQKLWQQSKHREAVSLLYRGALSSLFKQYRFELSPGATEQDCIRQLQLNSRAGSDVTIDIPIDIPIDVTDVEERIKRFTRLTDVWVSIAYAHRFPEELVFSQICDDWNHYFSIDKATG